MNKPTSLISVSAVRAHLLSLGNGNYSRVSQKAIEQIAITTSEACTRLMKDQPRPAGSIQPILARIGGEA